MSHAELQPAPLLCTQMETHAELQPAPLLGTQMKTHAELQPAPLLGTQMETHAELLLESTFQAQFQTSIELMSERKTSGQTEKQQLCGAKHSSAAIPLTEGLRLDKSSLDSLGEWKWLDDKAINCYGMALAASSGRRVAAFSPHWQTSMMAGRTRKVIKERLEARNAHRASMWLLPYNRWQGHWALWSTLWRRASFTSTRWNNDPTRWVKSRDHVTWLGCQHLSFLLIKH